MADIDPALGGDPEDPLQAILRMRMAPGPLGPASPSDVPTSPTNPFIAPEPLPLPAATGPLGAFGPTGPASPDMTPVPAPPATGPAGAPGPTGPASPPLPLTPGPDSAHLTPEAPVAPPPTVATPPISRAEREGPAAPAAAPAAPADAAPAAPGTTGPARPMTPEEVAAATPARGAVTPIVEKPTVGTPVGGSTLPKGVPAGAVWNNQRGLFMLPGSTVGWTGNGFPINLNGPQQTQSPDGAAPMDRGIQSPGTPTGGTPGTPTGGNTSSGTQAIITATSSLGDIMSQAQSIAGSSPEVGLLYSQQLQSILSMIDGEEAKLRAQYDAQGTTMDPATQYNLDILRKQLTEGIKKNDEDLNARGLYNSGIALEMKTKLQTGELSGEAQVLAERFNKLQTQLASGLQALSGQRITTARDIGLAGANAQSNADENTINRRTSLVNTLLGFRNTDQQRLATEHFTAAQNELSRRQQADLQAQTLQQEAARQQADFQAQDTRLKEQLQAAAQQGDANRAAELQKAILDTRAAADRAAADNAAALQRVAAQEAGANSRNAATIAATRAAAEAKAKEGGSAVYTDRAAAKYLSAFPDSFAAAYQDILQNQNNLVNDGVNIQTLIDTLKTQYAGKGIFGNER